MVRGGTSPSGFGLWNTVYRWLRRWSQSGVFSRVLTDLDSGLDMGTAMVDGTLAKCHQHEAGASKWAARLTPPENCKPLGGALAGSPRRSPLSPTAREGSSGSRQNRGTPTRAESLSPYSKACRPKTSGRAEGFSCTLAGGNLHSRRFGSGSYLRR